MMVAAASIEGVLSSSSGPLRNGVFVAVVGPSGAGKDTIIDYARAELEGHAGYHFVRRIVTRPASAGAEDHDTLSEEQFLLAKEKAEFSHCWHAHGLWYGLPRSVDGEVERGAVAIANVSRGVLPALRSTYAHFVVVHITASPEVLAKRLASRGRETADEIRRRLMRAAPNDCDPNDAVMIDNSSDVAEAGDEFVRILKKMAVKAAIFEQI